MGKIKRIIEKRQRRKKRVVEEIMGKIKRIIEKRQRRKKRVVEEIMGKTKKVVKDIRNDRFSQRIDSHGASWMTRILPLPFITAIAKKPSYDLHTVQQWAMAEHKCGTSLEDIFTIIHRHTSWKEEKIMNVIKEAIQELKRSNKNRVSGTIDKRHSLKNKSRLSHSGKVHSSKSTTIPPKDYFSIPESSIDYLTEMDAKINTSTYTNTGINVDSSGNSGSNSGDESNSGSDSDTTIDSEMRIYSNPAFFLHQILNKLQESFDLWLKHLPIYRPESGNTQKLGNTIEVDNPSRGSYKQLEYKPLAGRKTGEEEKVLAGRRTGEEEKVLAGRRAGEEEKVLAVRRTGEEEKVLAGRRTGEEEKVLAGRRTGEEEKVLAGRRTGEEEKVLAVRKALEVDYGSLDKPETRDDLISRLFQKKVQEEYINPEIKELKDTAKDKISALTADDIAGLEDLSWIFSVFIKKYYGLQGEKTKEEIIDEITKISLEENEADHLVSILDEIEYLKYKSANPTPKQISELKSSIIAYLKSLSRLPGSSASGPPGSAKLAAKLETPKTDGAEIGSNYIYGGGSNSHGIQ